MSTALIPLDLPASVALHEGAISALGAGGNPADHPPVRQVVSNPLTIVCVGARVHFTVADGVTVTV